jgi:hypothetical protein
MDCFETFAQQPLEDGNVQKIPTREYSTESSPIKKSIKRAMQSNYRIRKHKQWDRQPTNRNEYRHTRW